MTIENVIVIAIGLVATAGGLLMIRRRIWISNFFVDAQRALGGPIGRATAKGLGPSWIRFLGVMLTIIGLVAIGVGIFAREG